MGKNKGGSATDAMQTALRNQTNQSNDIISNLNTIMQQNSKYYDTPLAGETNLINKNLSAVSPGMTSGLSSLLGSGGDLSSTTGINQNQLGKQLVNYDSNPGGTKLAGQDPSLTSFYQGEMQKGIDPQFAQNQQNSIMQTLMTAINNAKATAAPGQNVNALSRDLTFDAVGKSANLGSQIAGLNQQVKQHGAEGVATTASNLDTQSQSMLMQALTSGLGINQQAVDNLLKALGQGTGVQTTAGNFSGQGSTNISNVDNSLAGLAGTSAQQANAFSQQAAQEKNSGGLLGGLLGGVGAALTGGAAGAGGFGSILKAL